MRGDESWIALIETERRLRMALCELERCDHRTLRRWWCAIASVLEAMVRPDGRFSEPLPMELFSVLGGLARYLAAGQIPLPISDVAVRGRTSPGPSEVRDIRLAVTYRHAVKKKLIKDPRPVKTIMAAYGLRNSRTVRKWCQRHRPLDLTKWTAVPDQLGRKMRKCGAGYQEANRRTWEANLRGAKAARK